MVEESGRVDAIMAVIEILIQNFEDALDQTTRVCNDGDGHFDVIPGNAEKEKNKLLHAIRVAVSNTDIKKETSNG